MFKPLFAALSLLITLVISVFTPSVLAAEVANLYSLSALVADASDETREQAAEQLLRQLVVKISGSEASLNQLPPNDFARYPEEFSNHPLFSTWKKLPAASQLVSQFGYKSSQRQLRLEDGSQITGQELTLSFEPTAVNHYLNQLNLAIWGANRPKVIFWVAIESRNGRYLLTPKVNQPLSDVIIEQNQLRGLPFALPNLSSSTKSQTLVSEIWGGFSQEVEQASKPYAADALMLGKIKAAADDATWQVEWQLIHNQRNYPTSLQATNLRQALEAGSNFAAENLARLYASNPNLEKSSYLIKISNLKQVKDLALLQSYLTGLSLTKSVEVLEAANQELIIKISLQASLEQFKANLKLDNFLIEEDFFTRSAANSSINNNSASNNENANELDAYFRWR